ncbi:MAG TPA: ATP-binding protein [Vicinamibacterales bacterium]|nr:ATP-binding protein [Vicinamibacterales bacterium]
MTLSLRARLAVSATVVFAVLIGALAAASYTVLARQLDADASDRLAELTDGLHGYLRFHDDVPSVEFDASDGDQVSFVQEATRYYQIYEAGSGRLLFQSSALAPLGLRLTPGRVRAYVASLRSFDVATDYGRLRMSNSLVPGAGATTYLLQVGVTLAPNDAALRRYRDLLLLGVPACLVLAGAGSWWLSAFALAPLIRLAGAAREIDVRTLERRLPTRGVDDELEDVARAFNGVLERLEHAVGEMRQFSAALAHELRTPLAALRGEIELALGRLGTADANRDHLASQIEEIDRLKRLIEQILTLARAEAGQIPLTFAPLDAGELAAALVDQLEPVAQARGIALTCEREGGAAVVRADGEWLRRLLINLLDNALKFTHEGGRVWVRVAPAGDRVTIAVHDTGVGIAPADRPHVFERFFRADPSRTSATEGTGLGLSLVQWIVERHGGSIGLESEVGSGTTFVVALPRTGP